MVPLSKVIRRCHQQHTAEGENSAPYLVEEIYVHSRWSTQSIQLECCHTITSDAGFGKLELHFLCLADGLLSCRNGFGRLLRSTFLCPRGSNTFNIVCPGCVYLLNTVSPCMWIQDLYQRSGRRRAGRCQARSLQVHSGGRLS